MKNRIFITFLIFCGLFSTVLMKAFYIQVINKNKLIEYANSQFVRKVKEYPNRGNILDRNGHPLAINVTVYNIYTFPKNKDKPYFQELKKLSKIVPELNYSKLMSQIKNRNKYTWLARKIKLNERQIAQIKKLKKVGFESHTERIYPNKELMAQTLGFVGMDNNGLAGVEFSLNKKLKGTPHIVKYLRDAKGRPIKFETNATVKDQEEIYLSIDKDIQGTLENYLKDAVVEHEALRGGAAVMDAQTGEMIAIANYPTFDPNQPLKANLENRKLAFATDPFEPGSIFKTFTIASALEHKVAKSSTKYFCEYGKLKVQNHIISEAEGDKKFEWLTVADILKYSSNVGTTKIAFDLKYPRLRKTLDKFGLTQKSGIEIASESKGILHYKEKDNVKPLTLSNISFGHGVATTAIQVMRGYAAFANGGYLIKPTLVKNESEQINEENRIISTDVTNQITDMLVKAVKDGTGSSAEIPHYVIAGKTGTAQRVSPQGGYDGYIASFIGYPVNVNKKFVVMVYVEAPKKGGYYGNVVAAPVFKKITQYILYKKKDFTQFANYSEKSNKTNLDIIKSTQSAPRSFGPGVIPDFTGLDKTSAASIASSRGIKIEMLGFGIVSRQSIDAGSPIGQGQVLKLHFRPPSYAD